VVNETLDGAFETMLVPASIALGTKKHGTLIVVNPVNLPAFRSKKETNFRSDKAR
jgi:hypothetical protein